MMLGLTRKLKHLFETYGLFLFLCYLKKNSVGFLFCCYCFIQLELIQVLVQWIPI